MTMTEENVETPESAKTEEVMAVAEPVAEEKVAAEATSSSADAAAKHGRSDRSDRSDRGDRRDKPKKEFEEVLLEVRRVTRVNTG